MRRISTRLPDELEEVFERYVDEAQLEQNAAVQQLIARGLDQWKRERAIERLEAGNVSFSRAAETSGQSVWDLAASVEATDCIWVGEEHALDDLEALEN